MNRGMKRHCGECEAAFYDLGKTPIVCPKCGAEHKPGVALKSDPRPARKSRPLPVKRAEVEEEAPEVKADDQLLDAEDEEVDDAADPDAEAAEVLDGDEEPAEGDEKQRD
jgi:uncharacterized protein (TIGR02300 family)